MEMMQLGFQHNLCVETRTMSPLDCDALNVFHIVTSDIERIVITYVTLCTKVYCQKILKIEVCMHSLYIRIMCYCCICAYLLYCVS